MKTAAKIEFGDFQTPSALAGEACDLLARLGERPDYIVEPTAGKGAFLIAASQAFPNAVLRGWEINPDYVDEARQALADKAASERATIECQDFFTKDWDAQLSHLRGALLLLGNPPWVTNAGVSVVNGSNLPAKENLQGLKGMAARTGKANFDISEWMLLRLLGAVRERNVSMAMLCKTSTARKFLAHAWKHEKRIASAALYRIDAQIHFGAAVDACLLYVRTGDAGPREADVFDSLSAANPATRIALVGKDMVSDSHKYKRLRHLEGVSPFRWRSGIKHDCAAIMELVSKSNDAFENGNGELVRLENEFLYPLLKCSDLANGRTTSERVILVTQKKMGEDTAAIEEIAPRTWEYLQRHKERFLARKSSIYKDAAPFSIFGIGEYTFAPWKVAISGLHKNMRFQVVGPLNGAPVCFDDTCYYISFERESDARLVCAVLNSAKCRQFIESLVFADSKRPITVELLQRLNIKAIAEEAGYGSRWENTQWRGYKSFMPQLELSLGSLTPQMAAG